MTVTILKRIYLNIPKVIRLLIGVILIMTLFGTGIHLIEPERFPTVFEGVWWAFVTGATVGFGDYVPLSTPGRLLGILIILTGGGMLAYYITTLSSVAIDRHLKETRGELAFSGSGHIILIGWNERTRQLIDMIYRMNPDKQMIVIDQTLTTKPGNYTYIHYIHGDPTVDLTLEQAAVYSAERVLVTANTSRSEEHADHMTILTTLAVRGLHQNVPIVAEVLTDKQINNAKRAGASTVIRPNDFLSTLLYHELVHSQHSTPFENILQLLNNQQFKQIAISETRPYSNFKKASIAYLEHDYILIGIIRDNKWVINPPADFSLKDDDTLLMLTSWTNENE